MQKIVRCMVKYYQNNGQNLPSEMVQFRAIPATDRSTNVGVCPDRLPAGAEKGGEPLNGHNELQKGYRDTARVHLPVGRGQPAHQR